MNADDIKYILAEEGRYGVYEDDDVMNEGCAAIDMDLLMEEGWPMWRPTSYSLTCTMSRNCPGCINDIHDSEPVTTDEDDKPPTKKVSSDPRFGDYDTPDDIKSRGGENYHLNKQKSKPHSPKSERRKQREKRVKDIRTKESRIHKRAVVYDL